MASEHSGPVGGEALASLLRQHRRERGLTQEQLAEQSGLSARAVQDLERGTAFPRRDTLSRLIAALGLEGERRVALEVAGRPRPRARGASASRPASAQVQTNLPRMLTKFIGREAEITQLRSMLVDAPLLTLTGTGGVGKSRLAVELAAEMLPAFRDGIFLIELAALTSELLIPETVASAVDVREQPGQSLVGSVIEHLRNKQLLLVLDNCEHVLNACATLATNLLQNCRKLTVLATSREPLQVAGETTWRVASLAAPGTHAAVSVDDLLQYDAVRLFVERALANEPNFALTPNNAQDVARVCSRLDGIPLAIELAATRIRMLTVEQIAERLDSRFQLLSRGNPTAPPRHQQLRAAVDWSYDMLDDAGRMLFNQLSVFAGGFTIEAVEAICAGEPIRPEEVLDVLMNLVDKSLVLTDPRPVIGMRYRLLDTLRQYGVERLSATGDTASVQRRHRDWYVALAEAAEPQLWGPRQVAWFARIDAELDNLRAALEFSRDDVDSESGLRLATSLWHYWSVRGRFSEGRDWLASLAPNPDPASEPTPVRVRARAAAAYLAFWQGDYPSAIADSRESQALALEMHDVWTAGLATTTLGTAAYFQTDASRAATLLTQALGLWQSIGEARGICATLVLLAMVEGARGDFKQAEQLLEDSMERARGQADSWSMANAALNRARLAFLQADMERAEMLCREALARYTELDDKRMIALCLHSLALQASSEGDAHRSAMLLGAASVFAGAVDLGRLPLVEHVHDACVAQARQAMGEGVFESVRAAGREMSFHDAVAYALGQGRRTNARKSRIARPSVS